MPFVYLVPVGIELTEDNADTVHAVGSETSDIITFPLSIVLILPNAADARQVRCGMVKIGSRRKTAGRIGSIMSAWTEDEDQREKRRIKKANKGMVREGD